MFSKGSTWPPRAPARARVISGTVAPTITDRLEGGRPPAESIAATHGDSRPAEPHWEPVIDRATD